MSIGIPLGVSEDEVASIAGAALAFLFRRGTNANAPPPNNGQAFVFTGGADQIVGEGITALPNGKYRLAAGTYWLTAVIRSGNYSIPSALIIWQWRDFTNNVGIGNESIHYANSSTSAFTHQPIMNAPLIVPEGETRDIGPALVGASANNVYVINEARSSITVTRLS